MKLLVCYGGNAASLRALELAIAHAVVFGATLHLVTVLQDDREGLAELKLRAETALAQGRATAQQCGVAVESQILQPGLSVGEALVTHARDLAADLIYIGVESKSKVGKLLFGSTAQYLILEAGCPVVSVK